MWSASYVPTSRHKSSRIIPYVKQCLCRGSLGLTEESHLYLNKLCDDCYNFFSEICHTQDDVSLETHATSETHKEG